MKRCIPFALCAALLAAAPAQAQTPLTQRTFPVAAQRGDLRIASTVEAVLNGKPIRMAPGLRIFSPQNTLVFAHTLIGQPLRVNYVIEASTGMLHTVWILTEAEAEQKPGKGAMP